MTTVVFAGSALGTGSGSSAANAAAISTWNAKTSALIDGDTCILLEGNIDVGSGGFNVTKQLNILGRKTDLTTPVQAKLFSNRTNPWPANGMWTDSGRYTAATMGANVFILKDGAVAGIGALFDNLMFSNVGTPIKPSCTDNTVVGTVRITNVRTYNTNGLLYIDTSNDGQVGVTASNCFSVGYSEGQFRTFGPQDLTNCHGDARSQFHNPGTNLFGSHVQDAVVVSGVPVTLVTWPVTWVNCSWGNHNAQPPAGSSLDPATTGNYGQGDGGVTEENARPQKIENIYTYNNYDRGYDNKAPIPEGNVRRVLSIGDGFGFAMHDDAVTAWIVDSYLSTNFRPSYDNGKCAPLQASGKLRAKRCVLVQTPVGAPSNYLGAAYGSVQPQHVQSGVTIPQRTGDIGVISCNIIYTGTLTKTVMSTGGSPPTTPVYAETDTTVKTV